MLARADLILSGVRQCRQLARIALSQNLRGLSPGRMWNVPPPPLRPSPLLALIKQHLGAANPPLAPKQRRELRSHRVGYRLRHRRLLLLLRPRLSRGGQSLRLRIGPKRVSLVIERNRRATAAILKPSRQPEELCGTAGDEERQPAYLLSQDLSPGGRDSLGVSARVAASIAACARIAASIASTSRAAGKYGRFKIQEG